MSARDDLELLRAIWVLFDSPAQDLRQHPVVRQALPSKCLGGAGAADLEALLNCVRSKGKAGRALDLTLDKLREDWNDLSAETRSEIVQLAKFHPRRIKRLQALNPRDFAILSVRWDLADSLYADGRKAAFLQLTQAGLDLENGCFNPKGTRGMMGAILDLPDVLAALLPARIEFDLAAIAQAAPQFRKECEDRVRGRAEGERQLWYARIHQAVYAVAPDSRPDIGFILDGLNARLDPVIGGISNMQASGPRQAMLRELGASVAVIPEPPPEPSLVDKVIDRAKRNPLAAAAIVLVMIAGAVVPIVKPLRELIQPAGDQKVTITPQPIVYAPSPPITVMKGQAVGVVLTGKNLQGILQDSQVTADIRSRVKITGVKPSATAEGKEQIAFRLDASGAAAGSFDITVQNGAQKSAVPFTVTGK